MADMMMSDEDFANFFNNEFNSTSQPELSTDADEAEEYDEFDMGEILGDDEEEFDEEDEAHEAEDEDVSDEELDEVEQFTQTFTQKWDLIDDDHVFDFGDVKLTKADLADAATAREEHKRMRDAMLDYSSKFEEMNKMTDLAFSTARTETEGYLQTIRAKLKRGEFEGAAKVKAYDDIERLEARKAKLDEAATKAAEVHQVREAKMTELRMGLVDQEMNKRYGAAWGKQLAPQVVQYAVSQGIDQSTLVKNVSPALLEVLMKAAKFDNLQGKNKAVSEQVMKRGKGRVARSATTTQRQEKTNKRTSRSRAYQRAMENGDSSAAFALLED